MISGLLKKIAIAPVRFYQLTISPLTGSNCRHEPTCSQYTIESIREWGALRGIWMGIKRLLKCHPWGTHGHDPVPGNPVKYKVYAKPPQKKQKK